MDDRTSNGARYRLLTLIDKLISLNSIKYARWQVWSGAGVVTIILIGLLTRTEEQLAPVSAAQPVPRLAIPAPLPVAHAIQFEPLADATDEAADEALPLESAPVLLAGTPTPPSQFVVHTVQTGETLISIAAEYDLTTETVLTTNSLRDPTLKVGQLLLIPAAEGLRIPVVHHEIKPEDDLIDIAAQYGSSVKDILAANPALEQDNLPVGETVLVPIIFDQPKPEMQLDDESEASAYLVQPGDTPLGIAARFNVPVEVLLSANGIVDPTRLAIGQELYIPASDDVSLGFPVILHEFLAGETLLGLASQYGSSAKDILAINPTLDPGDLQPGELVAIPIVFDQPRPTPEPGQAPEPLPRPPVEVSAPLSDLQTQMIAAINAEREANGLPPYQADEQLTGIAVAYAQEMVSRDFFSHTSPEGVNLRGRIAAGGISDALAVGENIQVNTQPRDKTVGTALTWFLSSRPHRHNLLHPNHNRIGIGIVEGPPGWYTFVLNFAQR